MRAKVAGFSKHRTKLGTVLRRDATQLLEPVVPILWTLRSSEVYGKSFQNYPTYGMAFLSESPWSRIQHCTESYSRCCESMTPLVVRIVTGGINQGCMVSLLRNNCYRMANVTDWRSYIWDKRAVLLSFLSVSEAKVEIKCYIKPSPNNCVIQSIGLGEMTIIYAACRCWYAKNKNETQEQLRRISNFLNTSCLYDF